MQDYVDFALDILEVVAVQSSRQQPQFFAVGVIGLGAIGIPVLAGSASYAACDALGWAQGLDRHYKQARGFYVIIFAAVAAGIGLNLIGIDPIRALMFTAVFNGVASIPLVFLINRVARDRRIMGDETSGRLSTILLGITFIAMAAGAVAMAAPLIGR